MLSIPLMLLVSCASSGAGVGRILERPADFPEGVVYTPVESQRGKMWCLSDPDYIAETKHIVKLNHVIDKYECQINILNGEKCEYCLHVSDGEKCDK